MTYEEMLELNPYSLGKEEKQKLIFNRQMELMDKHIKGCSAYKNIINVLHKDIRKNEDIPFLPVRMFKDMELMSVEKEDVFKTMTSSGTTGQQVSKIYLDRVTASNQQKTLVKIVSEYLGSNRVPMIIMDCPSVVKDRKKFSARGAGILGFSIFASKKIYAFDDDMNIDIDALKEFIDKYKDQRILVFGFTFMIWQYFYKAMKNMGEYIDLHNGVMIHGGGWKKLASESVSSKEFKECIREVSGMTDIHDYYGMVEQTGCIYMECECGYLHTSIFSDVITRRSKDFSVCDNGEEGIIQVLSSIPESYPGQSILTEDKGFIVGEDDCKCGRLGKYFVVTGRIKNAEVRGCSDTYEQKV